MTLLNIRIYPDPILKEEAAEVSDFDSKLSKLLDDMYDTMLAADGIGLAAPQIGISKKIAVIDISEDRDQRLELINPKIVWQDGQVPSEEGCLSIPQYRDKIKRFKEIKIEAHDRKGAKFELQSDGLLAICMQHEIDHLHGILFVDHLSRLKRELFKRWSKRNLEEI